MLQDASAAMNQYHVRHSYQAANKKAMLQDASAAMNQYHVCHSYQAANKKAMLQDASAAMNQYHVRHSYQAANEKAMLQDALAAMIQYNQEKTTSKEASLQMEGADEMTDSEKAIQALLMLLGQKDIAKVAQSGPPFWCRWIPTPVSSTLPFCQEEVTANDQRYIYAKMNEMAKAAQNGQRPFWCVWIPTPVSRCRNPHTRNPTH